MRVRAVWIVKLPLKFYVGNNFNKTPLTKFVFNVDDMNFELLKSSENTIERVKITLFEEYDDNFLPSYENSNYLSEFINKLSYKASKTMQRFLDGFSKTTNAEYYQIFDGEDFTTPYELEISPNIMTGSGIDEVSNECIYLDDETLTKSINFISKEKNTIDNAWYFLRDAEYLIDIGKYEISLINMAIMIEFLVKAQLSNFLDDNDYFIKVHARNIKSIYGDKASFVERYFRYGLTLVTEKYLSDDIHDTIDFIYKVRNKLAHGKKLQDLKMVNENDDLVNENEMSHLFKQLFNNVVEIYNYFYDLNT